MTPARIILTSEVDFEKEYKEFLREGIEIHGPKSMPEKGDELWFQIEAGLPKAGIDPEKDTTHVLDGSSSGCWERRCRIRDIATEVL
jgi:hypothetical protein